MGEGYVVVICVIIMVLRSAFSLRILMIPSN